MKAFVSVPVQILGKQFLGTRESAKEIVEWIRNDEKAGYQNAELRENVDQFGFDSLVPHARDNRQVLTIFTESARLVVYSGEWLVLFVETGVWSTYTHSRLTENYAEL